MRWAAGAVHLAALATFLVLVATGHGFAPAARVLDRLLIVAPALACVTLGLVGGARERGWVLIGAGLLAWAGGDIVYVDVLGFSSAPMPSVADVLYLATYPLVIAGGWRLLRAEGARVDRRVAADGAIAGLGAAALLSGVALGSAADAASRLSLAGKIVTLAYPVLDLVLLAGAVVALIALDRRLDRRLLLFGAAALVWAVADSFFAREVSHGTYGEGGLVAAGWPVATGLLAAAAWAPASRRVAVGDRNRLSVPIVVAASMVVLEVYDHFTRMPSAAVVLAGASLVAALARLRMAADDVDRSLRASRRQALTDPVTGLPNRHALMTDLRGAVTLAEDGRRFAVGIYDLDGFKGYNDTFGHPTGDALLERLGARLRDACPPGRAYRIGGDEFCLLVPLDRCDADAAARSAATALRETGDAFLVAASGGWAVVPDDGRSPSEVLRAADRRMYAAKGTERMSDVEQTRRLLATVLAERDPDLGAHVSSVADMAVCVGAELGLDEPDLARCRMTAELHDVGKLAVPDAILRKPGPLDDGEWRFMREHTVVGQRICASVPSLAHLGALVRATHERWDGGGYPDRLAGPAIPRVAQIVFCCDTFDAMTTDRAYRPAMPPSAALRELRACAGTQFDPAVVEAFCRVWARDSQRLAAA